MMRINERKYFGIETKIASAILKQKLPLTLFALNRKGEIASTSLKELTRCLNRI